MDMVDSKQKELDLISLVQIATENQDNDGMDLRQIAMALTAEMLLPTTDWMRYGNTLFIINRGEGRDGYMRAFNADTSQNFIENCRKFSDAAYYIGYDNLITEFTTPSFAQIFNIISRNPPRDEMGYELQDLEDGSYRVIFSLGPERTGVPLI